MRRELDSRTTGTGSRVSLVWDDETDRIEVEVEEEDAPVRVAVVAREAALDAFHHPNLYLPGPAPAMP